METDAEHVDAEPGETRHDVAEDRHHHQSALTNESAPAGVKRNRAPENDQHGAIFFWIPTPEPAPRLVGPDPAEHRADKTEQRRKTNHAVSHPRERISGWFGQRAREDAAHDIDD